MEYAGQDICTEQYVASGMPLGLAEASGLGGVSGSSTPGALSALDLDCSQVFKMMMEQMKLDLEQRTGLALGITDDEEDEEKGRYL